MASGTERAFKLLKQLPKVNLNNLKPLYKRRKSRRPIIGRGRGGMLEKHNLPPLGIEGGQTPFYLRIPKEPYYKNFHERRQLPELSLLQLQRLVDTGYLDLSQPVDLTCLSHTPLKRLDPLQREFGYNLTDEGADCFVTKMNLEVQHASELAIAAVEKAGGTISTKFYDLLSVEAMVNPEAFFKRGVPIPFNKLPPRDTIAYYTDPKNRGYLADPGKIDDARFELAQKYGYSLPNLEEDPDFKMLVRRKGPSQIWFGLEAGWVVNLKDELILRPRTLEAKEYYEAEHIYGGSLADLQNVEEAVGQDS